MSKFRNASTPYERGFTSAIILIVPDACARGNNAPDKKNVGMMRKLIINGNACISSSIVAIAVPNAVKTNAIRNMMRRATGSKKILSGLKPMARVIKKTMIP